MTVPPAACSGAACSGVSAGPAACVSVEARGRPFVEERRDAEIEQLDLAAGVDQHVRRLEIAVDHEVGVRVGDGVGDLQEQLSRAPTPSAWSSA